MRYVLGLLLASLTASAQYPYQRPYDRDQYSYNRDGRYYNRGGDVFDRLRSDLDRAEANSYRHGGDRRRFDKVREEMSEFQRTGSRRELDDSISALQNVVNRNRLSNQDRDALGNDLDQLRAFRGGDYRRNGWR